MIEHDLRRFIMRDLNVKLMPKVLTVSDQLRTVRIVASCLSPVHHWNWCSNRIHTFIQSEYSYSTPSPHKPRGVPSATEREQMLVKVMYISLAKKTQIERKADPVLGRLSNQPLNRHGYTVECM